MINFNVRTQIVKEHTLRADKPFYEKKKRKEVIKKNTSILTVLQKAC